jgi:hypothetical protein
VVAVEVQQRVVGADGDVTGTNRQRNEHGGLPVAAVLILPVLILNFDF